MSTYIETEIKLLRSVDRLIELRDCGKTIPAKIEISPSNVCQMACPFCYCSHMRYEGQRLSLEDQLRIVEEAGKLGIRALAWTGGGEPTLAMHEEVVVLAKEVGLKQGLITNGLLPRFFYDNLDCFTWIRFSMNSTNKENFKVSQGVDAYKKVVSNFRKLKEIRDSNGIETTLGMRLLTPWSEMKTLEEFCNETHADYYQISPVHGHVTKPLKQEEWMEGFNIIENTVQQAHEYVGMPICASQYISIIIDAYGDVYPCCATLGMKQYVLGNLVNSSLESFISGEARDRDLEKRINSACTSIKGYPMCSERSHRTNQFYKNLVTPVAHEEFVG